MIKGSCHCGSVRYEIEGDIERIVHCHCHTCRKVNGTVFGTSALADSGKFRVTRGEDDLVSYESTPGKHRCFCRHCGSHVVARVDSRPEVVVLRIGTLDDDPGTRPMAHIWVSQKAPWYEITGDLPQFEEFPDQH